VGVNCSLYQLIKSKKENIMNQIIEAIFNGKVFEPSSTVNLKPNTKVKITIEEENQEIKDQSYSFLKTAKNLKIDAPPDFSSNLDSYLYGEKHDHQE
jgi:predicted DNA-binding antitoxin AbrB/MazE fold protein